MKKKRIYTVHLLHQQAAAAAQHVAVARGQIGCPQQQPKKPTTALYNIHGDRSHHTINRSALQTPPRITSKPRSHNSFMSSVPS